MGGPALAPSRLRALLGAEAGLWLRPLLVVGLLLLSLGLAPLALRGRLWLVVLPAAAAVLAVIYLRWPIAALILASLAGMVVPWTGPSGLNVAVALVAGLLALWLLDRVAHRRPIWLPASRPAWLMLAFLAVAVLTFCVGQLRWFTFAAQAPLGAQLAGLAIVLLSGGMFLLAASHIQNLGSLSTVTWAFLAFCVLFVVMRLILPDFGLATRDLVQPAGAVFFIWLMMLAFSMAAFNGELSRRWRLALAGLVLFMVFYLVVRKFNEKSTWLPVLAGLAAILVMRSWRLGLALGLAAALAGFALSGRLLTSEAYSVATRFEAWQIMLDIIKVSPLWGLGFGNYYWYTPLFPIRGYAVSFNSHNNYIDILAQTGVAGLVCFVWLLWELGRLAWRLRQQAPAGFARAFTYAAWGGLVGMAVAAMLGDWVLPFFYNIGLTGFRSSLFGWLFLGGLLSLERLALPPRKS
jgi:hypothetical protein